MKKLCLLMVIMLLLFYASPVLAVDQWETANQTTVGWDAITYQIDPGERVTYQVYLANSVTDPNKANPQGVGSTQGTTHLITLNVKGSFFAGVQSTIEIDDGSGNWSKVSESVIVWSDDPQAVQGGVTFGIRFYPAPNAVTGLRPV